MAKLRERRLAPGDEPAVYTGGLLGLFGALVVALSAFDVIDWTSKQQAAVGAVAVIVLPWVQGFITRQFVRPVDSPQRRGF